MIIKISKELLMKKVSMLSKLCTTSSNNPILSTILFETKGKNAIELIAYNTAIGCKTTVENEIENDEEDSFTLSASFLMNCLSKAPANSIINLKIEKDTEKLNISYNNGKVKYSTLTQPADEYPELPKLSGEESSSITVEQLINGIDSTLYCIEDGRDGKPRGLNIVIDKKSLSFKSLANSRLCEYTIDNEYDGERFNAIISRENAKYIRDIAFKEIKEDDDIVTIIKDTNHISFTLYDYTIISIAMAGEEYDFDQFLPKQNSTKITIKKNDLENSLVSISPVIESTMKNPVIAEVTENGIDLTTVSNIGKSKIFCDFTSFEGKPIKLGFNLSYMLEALKNISSEEIEVLFAGPVSPIIIYNINNRNNYALFLPLRIKNSY